MPTTKAFAKRAANSSIAYLRIGQIAKLSGVSAKMIRHYESLCMIPKPLRSTGDYRLYDDSDVHTLRFIRRARDLGFPIKEIAKLLGLWRNQRRSSADVKRLALKHVVDLGTKIAEMNAMRATLAHLASHCHGDHRPECPILDDLSTASHT